MKRKKVNRLFKSIIQILIILGFILFFGVMVYLAMRQDELIRKAPLQGKISTEKNESTTENLMADMVEEDDYRFIGFKDESGNVIWEGISQVQYESMSSDEQIEYDRNYLDTMTQYWCGNDVVEDMDQYTKLFDMDSVDDIRHKITQLGKEYNGTIPYSLLGRSYALGFNKQTSYDNSLYMDGCGYGLDSEGYVIWFYRNSLGITPEEMIDGISLTRLQKEIELEELEVGDLCVADINGNEVYGIVIGDVDGNQVVSMIDNRITPDYPYGCNHMSYIKSQNDELVGFYPAVDFRKFYRIKELL